MAASLRDNAYLAHRPFASNGRPAATAEDYLAWAKDIIAAGKSYLKLQPAYPYIQDGIDIVNGNFAHVVISTISGARTEMTVRNLKELIAAQTNIRIIPAFKSEANEFRDQTEVLNRGFMAWQGMTFADRKLRKAWQYACAAGTGYIGTRFDPNYYYKGKGDIVWDAYGPLDVLPVGMGRQHDLQKAYAVALRVPTPIHEAWRLFPEFRDHIKPKGAPGIGKGNGVQSWGVRLVSPVLRKFGLNRAEDPETVTWDDVDIYYIYVDDDSANDTGRPILMGDPGTNWSYKVPFIGQEIPYKIENGEVKTRTARRTDCMLYPNRRLIKVCEECCLNPAPELQASPYWHARVPVVQLRADDWPWMFLGMPLTRQGQSLEKANIDILRGMVDATNCRLSPPRGFDQSVADNALMQVMDTRIPGQAVPMNYQLTGENVVRPFLPVNFYEYPATSPALVTENEARIKYQMGVPDTTALARARQLPAGDSTEKILEAMGPLVKDQSRNMEEPIRALGELWKSNWFQFITASRRLQLLGPDGLTEEDFDYDPGTLIPLKEPPDEFQRILEVPQFERARWHKDNFTFSVTPYSLHELNSITRKLFYLQLAVRGFPLDPWTEAELFDIKNFGAPPQFEDPTTGEIRTANTIMERWTVWSEIQSRIAASRQGPGGQQGGGGKPKGRPPSGNQPPTFETKSGSDMGRSTVRESKR